jgi:hypothetical protein
MRTWTFVVVALLCVSVASAGTIWVANTSDKDYGSLRWAIDYANRRSGPDEITFDPVLAGSVIFPRSQLPDIADDQTTIDGDVNDDGKPDIAISGRKAGSAHGLVVKGDQCAVRSLTITAFSGTGVVLFGASGCHITGCAFGVAALSRFERGVGQGAIRLWDSHNNTIGGTTPRQRNILTSGRNSAFPCIAMRKSSDNVVIGNYFGLAPNGSKLLGSAWDGIVITNASGAVNGNRIGGTAPGAGNVFAGIRSAVVLSGATNTQILGNLFGLKADGETLAPVSACVKLGAGTTDTQIGGTTAGARNIFAGVLKWYAIDIGGSDTADNVIQGNYFGTNQAGTEPRRLGGSVIIWQGAGAQAIGGSTSAAGNYITGFRTDGPADGIQISGNSSAGIQNNAFGLLPAGGAATGLGTAIGVYKGSAWIVDNTITHAAVSGIRVWADGAYVSAFSNTFRHCREAVYASHDVTCRLGNLGNASGGDDGGNKFHPSNDWFIYNTTAHTLKAEGNDFFTTSMAAIDAKIFDQLDCPSAGRVDYIPLEGGVIPTGGTSLAALALTNAAAVPTKRGGAEIAFSLSAPANVTVSVLNVAGRPVATVARDQAAQAGTQRIMWSGQTNRGVAAPGGTYIVRIAARGDDGSQTQTLASLPMHR